jgi:hypothetical protein
MNGGLLSFSQYAAIFENGLRRFRIIFRQKNIDVNRPVASLADLNHNLKFTQTLNHNIFFNLYILT